MLFRTQSSPFRFYLAKHAASQPSPVRLGAPEKEGLIRATARVNSRDHRTVLPLSHPCVLAMRYTRNCKCFGWPDYSIDHAIFQAQVQRFGPLATKARSELELNSFVCMTVVLCCMEARREESGTDATIPAFVSE